METPWEQAGDDAGAHDSARWRGAPVEDLAELLINALTSDAVEEMDHPHVVVCTDRISQTVSYSGPYEDGLAALVAAERDHQTEKTADPSNSLSFSVVPLLHPAPPREPPGHSAER